MFDRKHRTKAAVIGMRVLAVMALVLTGWFGAANSVSAQASGRVDVAIFTNENGQPAYDACYVLVDFSNIGCDENADGRVMFDDVPYGTYTVQQTADLGPGRYVEDFTINVTGNRNSAGFESHAANIVNTGGSSAPSAQTSDVAIVTTENGRSITDACFVLVDYSNVGCDENADGKITFDDVPVGTYTVRQTENLGAGRHISDFTITVTGASSSDGWERFPVTVVSSGASSSASGPSGTGGAKDISLITRDPNNGRLLTGTCYILLNSSNEGCDENSDGQVTFAAMPPGTYTVRQTRTPAGFPTINDFPITVDDTFPNVPVGYLVKQARDQNTAGTRNVTFVFVDSRAYTKIVPAQFCLKIGTVSNVGCDEDLIDGQIDFLDVATGTHPLTFSNLPNGWQIMGDDRTGPSQTIESGAGPQIVYIGVYTGNGSGSGGNGTAAGTDGGATSSTSDGGGLVMSCQPAAACAGGTITVTTEDGTFISSCTMTGDAHDTSHPYSCAADNVPRGVTVVLTIDGIAPGYVAKQNPVYFDTTNAGRASHDTGFSLVPVDEGTSTGSSAPGANATEYGQLLGDWGRQHAYLSLNADGSGALTLNHGCCDGVTYLLTINTTSSPFIATIVDAEFRGEVGPDESADIGETIALQPTQKQGITVIVITMPNSSQGFQNKIPTCFGDDFDSCNTLPFSD
ncbi:MAG: MSCRAMM family protein [Thermomicrobiales bacterium]